LSGSEQERLRTQIEEFIGRRDYDAALRFAVREADQAYGRQRYAEGVEVLKALVAILKDRQVALWNIYVAAYQKIVGLDNQLKDKSATISDLIELSRYCIKLGDFDKALNAASSGVSIDARSTEALNQKARVFAYRRDYTQAFRTLEESLEISPHNARTLYLKGTILGNNGKFADALAVYEQVRMADPAYPGLGKAIAEMRRQIDWKVKAVEGPATGSQPLQPSEVDRVPAIQRKGKPAEPEDAARSALETLYDEAVVGDATPGAAPVLERTTILPEESSHHETIPPASDAEPPAGVPELPRQERMETIPVPRQVWAGQDEAAPPAVRAPASSEAAGLSVLSSEELQAASASERQESGPEHVQPREPSTGADAARSAEADSVESRLIAILDSIRHGGGDQDALMQHLSEAGEMSIPLTLGVLYFNFLHNPQDARAIRDLLAWLQRSGYRRLPFLVIEEAMEQGARIDVHDPQIAAVILTGSEGDMPAGLRTHRAELFLEKGNMDAYVREELAMVRQAAESSVSAEGLVHQLVQVLEHCLSEDACTRQVLATAADLGVLDQLIDRVMENPSMVSVPALEAAVVERLGRTGVDEATFIGNEALFQHVTLSAEKTAILRRILTNAVSPAVRRKVLQALLVLGTPNMPEYTELIGLMAKEHDIGDSAYLIQYLVDHRQEVTDARFLLDRLSHLVPMDFESRYGLGLAAEQLGVRDMAAASFIAAIRMHPGDQDTVQHALEAILVSGEYDRIADVVAFSQIAPTDIEGMVDKAAAETAELSTGSAEQRLVSAWGAYAGGRYEEAVAVSSATVRGGGDPRFFIPMALSFVRLGLPELASRELDRAVRQSNVTDDIRTVLKYQAAVIQLGQGNTQQATQLLQEVGESSPGFRDSDELLSRCGSEGSRIVKL
jgi:tetratricopeptide (TPR) repeat protein